MVQHQSGSFNKVSLTLLTMLDKMLLMHCKNKLKSMIILPMGSLTNCHVWIRCHQHVIFYWKKNVSAGSLALTKYDAIFVLNKYYRQTCFRGNAGDIPDEVMWQSLLFCTWIGKAIVEKHGLLSNVTIIMALSRGIFNFNILINN